MTHRDFQCLFFYHKKPSSCIVEVEFSALYSWAVFAIHRRRQEFELGCGNIWAGENYTAFYWSGRWIRILCQYSLALLGKMVQDIFRCHISLGTGCYFFSHTQRAARCGCCFHLSRHLSLGTIFHPKKAAHAVPLNQYFSSFSPKT